MCFCWLSPTKGAAEATAGERNELAAELSAELLPTELPSCCGEGPGKTRCGNAAGQQSCCYAVEESRN